MHHEIGLEKGRIEKRTGWIKAGVSLSIFFVAGCATHSYAPGPGMSASDYDPDSARCRLFGRGATPGRAFGAAGSTKFVVAAAVGAAIGGAIDDAILQHENFNDCMQARGWRIADGTQPNAKGPMGATLAVATTSAIPATSADGVTQPPADPIAMQSRRTLGLNVLPMTTTLAGDAMLTSQDGLYVIDVLPGGAAETAGLRTHDVLLSFQNSPVRTVNDLQMALNNVSHGTVVPVTVWRNGHKQDTSLTF